MTVRDLVMMAAGEIALAGTFVLGVFVGIALKRKDS